MRGEGMEVIFSTSGILQLHYHPHPPPYLGANELNAIQCCFVLFFPKSITLVFQVYPEYLNSYL